MPEGKGLVLMNIQYLNKILKALSLGSGIEMAKRSFFVLIFSFHESGPVCAELFSKMKFRKFLPVGTAYFFHFSDEPTPAYFSRGERAYPFYLQSLRRVINRERG